MKIFEAYRLPQPKAIALCSGLQFGFWGINVATQKVGPAFFGFCGIDVVI
jgi:hypothetical protein